MKPVPTINMEQLQVFIYSLELLSVIFINEPEKKFISGLKDENIFSDFPLAQNNKSIRDGAELITGSLKTIDNQFLKSLVADYTNLFIGMEKTLAPPYGSVYLSEDHIMFDKTTLEVREQYAKHKLKISDTKFQPDDHIGYELKFLVFLAQKILAGNNYGYHSDLKFFLENHLLKWSCGFFERINKYAATDFYRGIAVVSENVLIEFNNFVKI